MKKMLTLAEVADLRELAAKGLPTFEVTKREMVRLCNTVAIMAELVESFRRYNFGSQLWFQEMERLNRKVEKLPEEFTK